MKTIKLTVSKVWDSFNGCLASRYEDPNYQEFSDVREFVYSFEMANCETDKINLKQDVHNLKMDFKKAVREYKSENLAYGETNQKEDS